ncbi:STAS domain-containing protein [Pseudonocardia kujensis]|uniref:STAS domain-containing protein n=1 Tax=Pseudonocardia kujensis TaxID=1128675 RepID=UPI001E56B2FC|nr:STAS domain-containing protein [Pseudonocardia kujensis]MCE0768059.1 STAS domain-containing protein [Pseudonocardia kujensis]
MEAWETSLPGGLLLTVQRAPVAVVALAGEIDLANCLELEVVVTRVAADPGVEGVVVDLTGVGFLAACGVRCLTGLRMRLAAGGHPLQLVVAPDAGSLRRVLALIDGFDIVGSLAEAGAVR